MTIRKSLTAVLVLAIGIAASAPADAAKADPMQRLMQEIDKYAKAGDGRRTGALLKAVAALGPRDKEFAGWAEVASGAAAAAKRGDLGGAKLACATCHEKYKEAYLDKIVKHLPDIPDKH